MREFFRKAAELLASIPDFAMGLLLLLFAILVGAIGALVTRAVLARTRLGRKIKALEEGSGQKNGSSHAVKTVSRLVFLLLFLVLLPASLSKLGLEGVTASVSSLTESMLAYVPRLIGCVLLLVVGVLLADVVFLLLTSLFATLSLDGKLNARLNMGDARARKNIPFAAVFSYGAKVLILLLFIVEALGVLGFATLSGVGGAIIAYLPSLFVASLVFFAAYILCRVIDAKWQKGSALLRASLKGALIAVSFFIALSHLGVAPLIVNSAFVLTFAACALAFSLAVGLGGRQFVQDNLSGMKLFKKETKENQSSPSNENK